MTELGRRRAVLTAEEIHASAKAGAKEGMKEVLQSLGVDVDHPLETQADFLFLRTKRSDAKKFADAGKLALLTSIVAAVVTGMATAWGSIAKALAAMGGTIPHHGP